MQKKLKTNFANKKDVLEGFNESISRLKEKFGKTEKALSENLIPLEKESYHFISRLLVPETKWDNILYSHIFKIALQSEKLSAGSSYISILSAISFVENLLKYPEFLEKNENEIIEEYNSKNVSTQESLELMSKSLTKDLMIQFVRKLCEDKTLSTILEEAISLAGMEGNIQIENSENPSYSVELRYGYHFPAKIYKIFLPSFGTWMQSNCKIFLVDGIVEKVSEIDKILKKSYETKIPLVFVAQGFSEEVLATIKTNYDKKNFNIFPVLLGTDLDSLNVLNDISAVTRCKTISILSGDMLIYANYDELPIIDSIKCNESGMLIQHSKNRSAVGAQIKSLLLKRKEQNDRGIMDITSLFDKRISNLLSHTVIIHLPNLNKFENEYVRSRIDVVLRTIRTLVSYGFVNLNDLEKFSKKSVNNEIEIAINETIKNIVKNYKTDNKVPTLSLVLGIFLTGKSILQLMCSKGIVIIDG